MLSVSLFLSPCLPAQTPVYGTAQAASRVIGQVDFTTNLPGEQAFQLGSPTNLAVAGKKLILADGGLAFLAPNNNRVLIYNDYSVLGPLSAANVVLGQTAFGDVCSTTAGANQPCTAINQGQAGVVQNGFNRPIGVATDGTRLVIADSGNNRVLIYNNIPTANGANADVVIGQTNFTNSLFGTTQSTLRGPSGVMINAGKLFICDNQNHRVLIYNSIPTSNGASADVVLGQANFTSRTQATTASAGSMLNPWSVTTDGTRLIVTDEGNNRVLIWKQIPTANGTPADVVVGQVDFATVTANTGSNNTNFPRDAFSDGTRLIVSDSGNNRILVYNQVPTVNGAFPDQIIGQYDSIGHLEGLAAEKMANPMGMAPIPGGFLVADGNNRRVLEFDAGQPLVIKGNVVDQASLNGNGLNRPVNVQYSVQAGVSGGNVTAGTYYAKVTALSNFPRESLPSAEIMITVPQDASQLTVTWNPVSLATSYRVYFGRLSNLEDRFSSADLSNATPPALSIGGTPAPGDTISVLLTQDDATTFTVTYTVLTADTLTTISDNLANAINTNTANTAHGVTATSDHKGTISFAAKEKGSIGNSCSYTATLTTGTGTVLSPTGLQKFAGANDSQNTSTLTLLNYPDPPTIAGSFGNQRPLDSLVPGSLVLITGNFLAPSSATATATPLPLQLLGTTVWANGIQCPLVSVSPTNIVFQLPMELSGFSAGIQVREMRADGTNLVSLSVPVTLTTPQPSLYSADGSGIGGILALRADGSTVTSANPAQIGELITFYGTGFGLLADYPNNVTVALTATGGALIPASYFIRVTAIFPDGRESLGSGEQLISASSGNSSAVQLTWDPTPNAQKYRVYMGTRSLGYDRYFETDSNSFQIVSIYGASGLPPIQTNVPGDGYIHIATTIEAKVQQADCPLTFDGTNPGVVGVWRLTCVLPGTLSAADLSIGPADPFGSAEVDVIVGAIDSNHLFLPVKRPAPTSFTVTPAALYFSAVAGAGNPGPQIITVNKTGGGTLSWSSTVTTADGGTWLTTDVQGGTNTGNLRVSVDQTALTAGTWKGTITVTGTDGSGNPVYDANGNPLTLTSTVTFYVTASSARPQRVRLHAH